MRSNRDRDLEEIKFFVETFFSCGILIEGNLFTGVERNMTKGKLDKKTVAKYQAKLQELKEKIANDIKQIAEHASPSERSDSGDVSGHVMHLADVATDMYDREFSMGLASNDRELLVKIEKALKRIEGGTFGLCEECGCSISAARLEAIPYVSHCLKCQEKNEKK